MASDNSQYQEDKSHYPTRREAILKRRVGNPLDYNSYIKVEELANLQHLESDKISDWPPAHDEHLFIVIHQVYELWFKQMLHEIDSIRNIFRQSHVPEKDVGLAVHRLTRVTEIQQVLLQQLNVLETMTPLEFLDFRDYLFPASGFQSWQFRMLENKLGLKREQRLNYGKRDYLSYLDERIGNMVKASEEEPSLHDLVEDWLERTPFLKLESFEFWKHYRQAVEKMIANERKSIETNSLISESDKEEQLKELEGQKEHFESLFDKTKHEELREQGKRSFSFEALQAALLLTTYQDEPILQLPSALLKKLLDMDELLTTWRYRHALMVHRMIGVKTGTGGSSGFRYLQATVGKHRIFTDLFNLSTFLIPRADLPQLPKEIADRMNFKYDVERTSGHP
eukprot:gb/GECG01009459.1/.p1 GENE.gb/GECG01009459.1/~~gb/GECG01009459.1/.p1  ORF type:complete len:396 (+),score=62.32 gb/GECG01009459.1/:1-1188(+)